MTSPSTSTTDPANSLAWRGPESSYRRTVNASAFQTGGPLREGSLYVERNADTEIVDALCAKQSCVVFAPPETGKTSLRLRTPGLLRKRLEAAGTGGSYRCIDIDFAAIGAAATQNEWFFNLAFEIASKTGLDAELADHWEKPPESTPADRWKTFLLEIVLPKTSPKEDDWLVLLLDDVRAVASLPFVGTTFFETIRSLSETKGPRRLLLCLFGVLSPDTISFSNLYKSIDLPDFKEKEAKAFEAPLADIFGAESAGELVREILSWTSGHPYMTQRACYQLELDRRVEHPSARERVESAVHSAFLNRDAFEDPPLLLAERYLSKSQAYLPLKAILELYGQVLAGERVKPQPSSHVERHLRISGLVAPREDRGTSVLRPRNRIFERVFDSVWLENKQNEVEVHTLSVAREDAEPGQKRRFLLQGKPLKRIYEWSRERAGLAAREDELIQESLYSEMDVAQAARRRSKWWIGGMSAVTALAISAGVVAYEKRVEAEKNLQYATRLEQNNKKRKQVFQEELTFLRGTPDVASAQRVVLRGLELANEAAGSSDELLAPALRLLAFAQKAYWDATVLGSPTPGQGTVLGVALSPDAARSATVGPGNTASLWDATTGLRIASLTGHTAPVREVAFSRDGRLLATVSDDGTSVLWDGRTGQLRTRLEKQDKPVTTTAFSPGGDLLVTAGDDGVARLWDTSKGELVRAVEPHKSPIYRVRFSNDGTRFAVASQDRSARIWDVDGHKLATLGSSGNVDPAKGHTKEILDIGFSPDGTRAVTSGNDGAARIWDVKSGSPLFTLRGNGAYVYSATFSPDGKWVATGGKNDVALLWRAEDGTLVSTMKFESGGLNRVSFSPNGQILATAGADQHLRLWDVPSGTLSTDLVGHTGAVTDVVFSRDGSRMVSSANDGTARVWKPSSRGGPVGRLEGPRQTVRDLAYSEDGRRIAAAFADGTVQVWEGSGREPRILRGHEGEVYKSVFFQNGTRLATAGADGSVRIWDVEAGKELVRVTHGSDVVDLAISLDASILVTASSDKTARAWRTGTGELLWKLDMSGEPDGGEVTAVAISRGERAAVGTVGGAVRILSLLDGHEIVPPDGARKHHGKIRQLAFSPDGAKLVSTGNDRTAQVWDARSGTWLFALLGHTDNVGGASFSANGLQILTFSWDGTALVWNATDGQPVAFLAENTSPIRSALFSPRGQWVATGGLDGKIRLWDPLSGELLASFDSGVGDVWSLAFSPDGQRLAAGGQAGAVRLYASSKEGMIGAACRFVGGSDRTESIRTLCANNKER